MSLIGEHDGRKNDSINFPEVLLALFNIQRTTLYIMLYSPTYFDKHPIIMAEVCKLKSDKFIKISDIKMIDDNIRNGSICMNHFLKEARGTSVNNIYGELSLDDIDHFDR